MCSYSFDLIAPSNCNTLWIELRAKFSEKCVSYQRNFGNTQMLMKLFLLFNKKSKCSSCAYVKMIIRRRRMKTYIFQTPFPNGRFNSLDGVFFKFFLGFSSFRFMLPLSVLSMRPALLAFTVIIAPDFQ